MNFSSIQAYNLEPSNWQQQNYQLIGNNGANPLLPPAQQLGLPPPPPLQPHGGDGAGSIRPGSMSERARLAKIPIPEIALKCPRCNSTNTKFCYFNNYSLTQPRHFCKTCRRYWTKNGALRSVPVGGGCRRNKRSKSTNSKSPLRNDRQTTPTSTSTVSVSNTLGLTQQFSPALRSMPPNLLSQLTSNFTTDVGLGGYSAISAQMVQTSEMNFQGTNPNFFGMEPWRLQQFPLMDGSDPSRPGINYHFQGGVRQSSSMLTQVGLMKTELENAELNRARQFSVSGNDDERNNNIATSAWSELYNFSTSCANNINPSL